MEEKFTDREGAYATALYAQMEKSGIPSHMRNALADRNLLEPYNVREALKDSQ